jgi:hypothetical protein
MPYAGDSGMLLHTDEKKLKSSRLSYNWVVSFNAVTSIDLIYNYKLSLSQMLSDIFYTDSLAVIGTLVLTANHSTYMYMVKILGSRQVWLVSRGYLLRGLRLPNYLSE